MNRTGKTSFMLYMAYTFASSVSLISSFLVLYLTNSNISFTIITQLFLISHISKFTMEIPTGYVADKFGNKTSAVIGSILWFLSSLFLMRYSSVLFLSLSFFLKGLGGALISGSVESLYINTMDKKELETLNVFTRIAFFCATAASVCAGGIMIKLYGYFYVLAIDAAMAFLSLLFVICMRKEIKITAAIKERLFIPCLKYFIGSKLLVYLNSRNRNYYCASICGFFFCGTCNAGVV